MLAAQQCGQSSLYGLCVRLAEEGVGLGPLHTMLRSESTWSMNTSKSGSEPAIPPRSAANHAATRRPMVGMPTDVPKTS